MNWTYTQKCFFFLIVFLCINLLGSLALDKWTILEANISEGFEGSIQGAGKELKDIELYTWTTNTQEIYDSFYASVYDQISGQVDRTLAKCKLLGNIWKEDKKLSDPSQWSLLDVGCGTGHAIVSFASQDVGRIVGLDNSPAMLKHAETKVIPNSKLTDGEKQKIQFRMDSIVNPSACSAGEFTHITCLYFTFYYLKDQEEFFRMMNFWTKQGGKLAVEVVNKYKFDPILEPASPFIGFSLQKYSKERLRKSKIIFDKFEYESEFVLTDPKAEFYETFRFKNNYVRRQKHQFIMPNIENVVAMGKRAGWKYVGFQDLNPFGFEYGYLLCFEK
jgi:ubiquinone/menaquinone biosynthesis C-methylase UbiE